MVKKKKDNKKLGQAVSITIAIIFVTSSFIVFTQDRETQRETEFYLRIQVKDYTNPIQGQVRFITNTTLEDIFSMHGIFINQTCIQTDYLYCNDGEYRWNMYTNNQKSNIDLDYKPKSNDQIIFKYEKQ